MSDEDKLFSIEEVENNDYIIVDNNVAYETGSNSEKLFFGKIFAQISKLIKTPTDNPTASKWIANELRMKQLMFED